MILQNLICSCGKVIENTDHFKFLDITKEEEIIIKIECKSCTSELKAFEENLLEKFLYMPELKELLGYTYQGIIKIIKNKGMIHYRNAGKPCVLLQDYTDYISGRSKKDSGRWR